MPPLLVVGHPRQLPHAPAPAAEVMDVDEEKKAVSVTLPAPVYNSLTEDVSKLLAETIKAPPMVFRFRPVFGEKGRVEPRSCPRLACTSKRSTKGRHPADNPIGTDC